MKTKEEKFEKYKPWVLEHEKYPNPKSDDEVEKSLGIWRKDCRKKKFKPLLDFDKEVNFNKSRKSPEEKLEEEYKPWVLEHEKYPSKGSDDKLERSLGQWRSIYRSKKFKPLLDFDKGVNFKSRKSPEIRIEEYKSWVLEHEKYPSRSSNDKLERSLGLWRNNYRRKKFKPLLDFDKEVNFRFCSSHKSRKSPEERFIKEYIPWRLKYKKYPSPTSEDKTEKSLGQWRHNYRIKNFEQLKNFDIFYSNYLIGNRIAIEIFNKLKEKGII